MSRLKQATKTNQQLKFFGRKMFHSTYSKVKPRVRIIAKNKVKTNIYHSEYERYLQNSMIYNRKAYQNQLRNSAAMGSALRGQAQLGGMTGIGQAQLGVSKLELEKSEIGRICSVACSGIF